MRLSKNDLHHISSVAHLGKHLLFGVDSNCAVHYCIMQDATKEAAAGYRLTAELLAELRTRPEIGRKLDGLADKPFAKDDQFTSALEGALGVELTAKLKPELLKRARETASSRWGEWQLLPLPRETVDESVVAHEHEQALGGLVTSLYLSHKDSAFAPVQVVSDGTHLHVFRQSLRGTLLVDRFLLDPDADRLLRKIEVRFKRSRKRYTPLAGAGGREIDSRDFRDANGAFFLEPTLELHRVGKLEAGRFAVVLVPTHEHDRSLWHIFAWDAERRQVVVTTLRRTEETLLDVRDYTIVEGDENEKTYRQIAGIRQRRFDLRDATDTALELSGALTATMFDLQREIEGDDGERQLVKVERRVLLAVVTAQTGKLAALSFALHADGSLAPLDSTQSDQLLRERNLDLRLPSDLLDKLLTCHEDRREPPPAETRRGFVFDADAQRIESRGPITLAGTSFTIELWARQTPSPRAELVLTHGPGGRDQGLHLAFDDHRFRFGFYQNDLTTPEPCLDGEWHHWACVHEKDGPRRIYRDGVLIAEDRSATPYRGEGPLLLGGAPWGQPFAGEVADVRVWRTARSEAEIRTLMTLRLTGNELGLVAHWLLDTSSDDIVRSNVRRGPDAVVRGAHRRGRVLSRRLSDDSTPVTAYRNDSLVAIAERSTYIESLELRSDADSGGFDFVFWGETVGGAATPRVVVLAQIEALGDGWKRASARFTAGVGMTRLRSLEISAPAGAWNRLELRNHRIELLCNTVTEATQVDVVKLVELAPEQDALLRIQASLDTLEGQEAEVASRLRWLDMTLANDPSAAAAGVAQIRREVDALAAEAQARAAERAALEGSLTYGGSIALRGANGKNDRYLSVEGIHVDAKRDQVGPWETFFIENAASPGDQGLVRYGDWVALKAHTGKYLIADNPTWPASHYYWVTAVYPAIGAYERWQIIDPANPQATGPVPRGGGVALRSSRDDRGSKYMMTGTAGPWWQKMWCEHNSIQPDAKFLATHLAESPAVEGARQRHGEASRRLEQRSGELATAERLANAAKADRGQVERTRATVQGDLAALRARIASEVTTHLTVARSLADAPLTMPLVTPVGRSLSVQGAILGFARTRGRPVATASLEGGLHLHFPGIDGRRCRCVFDVVGERWQPDLLGSCLRFDGTGAVTIPHAPTFSPSTYTIEMWFRWNGTVAAIQFLIGKAYEELEIHIGGTLTGSLRFIPAPGIYVDTAADAFRPGEWVHLACVYSGDASTAQIYLDGMPMARGRAGSKPSRPASTAPIIVGRRSNGDYPFMGEISELRLWNVALSQEEIVAQMHQPLTGYEPGLAGYWPLRDGQGDRASDCSRGEHHGTISGPRHQPSTSPVGRARLNSVPSMSFARAGSIAIPHIPAYATAAFSVEMWMRWSGSGEQLDFLIGKAIEELEIHTGGSTPGGLRFIPAAGIHVDTAANVLTPGRWTHVACVYAGTASSAQIYLDGVPRAEKRSDLPQSRTPSAVPITIGARGGGSYPFGGALSELRLWNVALTQQDVQARMHQTLTGREANLIGYWPLRDGLGDLAIDMSPSSNHGKVAGPQTVRLPDPRDWPPIGLVAADVILTGEYDTIENDGNEKRALLRRFHAWPTQGGVQVAMGQRVDTLEMRWLGNTQMNPTLVGYIEGAPPVPSENLTVEDNYNGASSVEFKVSEETTSTFTHDLSVGSNSTFEGAVGVEISGDLGIAAIIKIAKEFSVSVQATGKLGLAANFLNQHTRSGTSTVTTSETLSLKGEREKVAQFPALGLRFVPKNVGYATVVSTLADVFVVRLRGNQRMVSYRIAPVKDVPPDVNTVTFLINPAYTLNGSLDGQIGSHAADARFYGHIPAARGQYGSEVAASYYRVREAYALKDAIDRSNRSAEAIAINVRSDLLDGVDRDLSSENPSRQSKEAIEADATNRATNVTDAAAAKMQNAPKGQRLEQVIDETPKGNIVNSYVWDGDGGLRIQTQSFASSWQNVFGGSVSAEVGLGLSFSVRAFVAVDFNAMLGFNLTETLTNTTSTARAIELNVSVDCERRDITDNQDRPLYPGEKVDRYRFMSFALQPATNHFTDFFARVVDPEWLRSDDEEAGVLRQIDQGRPNKAWRVLHRVTYVERPSRGGGG